MALKIKNFTLPDGVVLEEAYLRVQTTVINNIDYDFLQPIDGTEDFKLEWLTRFEFRANVNVYGDEVARRNLVPPMTWFDINFKLDKVDVHPFTVAYNYVKEMYPEAEDC